jgi:hypothetical protein
MNNNYGNDDESKLFLYISNNFWPNKQSWTKFLISILNCLSRQQIPPKLISKHSRLNDAYLEYLHGCSSACVDFNMENVKQSQLLPNVQDEHLKNQKWEQWEPEWYKNLNLVGLPNTLDLSTPQPQPQSNQNEKPKQEQQANQQEQKEKQEGKKEQQQFLQVSNLRQNQLSQPQPQPQQQQQQQQQQQHEPPTQSFPHGLTSATASLQFKLWERNVQMEIQKLTKEKNEAIHRLGEIYKLNKRMYEKNQKISNECDKLQTLANTYKNEKIEAMKMVVESEEKCVSSNIKYNGAMDNQIINLIKYSLVELIMYKIKLQTSVTFVKLDDDGPHSSSLFRPIIVSHYLYQAHVEYHSERILKFAQDKLNAMSSSINDNDPLMETCEESIALDYKYLTKTFHVLAKSCALEFIKIYNLEHQLYNDNKTKIDKSVSIVFCIGFYKFFKDTQTLLSQNNVAETLRKEYQEWESSQNVTNVDASLPNQGIMEYESTDNMEGGGGDKDQHLEEMPYDEMYTLYNCLMSLIMLYRKMSTTPFRNVAQFVQEVEQGINEANKNCKNISDYSDKEMFDNVIIGAKQQVEFLRNSTKIFESISKSLAFIDMDHTLDEPRKRFLTEILNKMLVMLIHQMESFNDSDSNVNVTTSDTSATSDTSGGHIMDTTEHHLEIIDYVLHIRTFISDGLYNDLSSHIENFHAIIELIKSLHIPGYFLANWAALNIRRIPEFKDMWQRSRRPYLMNSSPSLEANTIQNFHLDPIEPTVTLPPDSSNDQGLLSIEQSSNNLTEATTVKRLEWKINTDDDGDDEDAYEDTYDDDDDNGNKNVDMEHTSESPPRRKNTKKQSIIAKGLENTNYQNQSKSRLLKVIQEKINTINRIKIDCNKSSQTILQLKAEIKDYVAQVDILTKTNYNMRKVEESFVNVAERKKRYEHAYKFLVTQLSPNKQQEHIYMDLDQYEDYHRAMSIAYSLLDKLYRQPPENEQQEIIN